TLRLALAVCCVLSLAKASYRLAEWSAVVARNDTYRAMETVLRQAPTTTRQIYVIPAQGLQPANPEYVRPALCVPAEIVRVIEIDWKCRQVGDFVSFDHSFADGIVSMTVTLPTCANFKFFTERFNKAIANGRLRRNDTMSYELPEAYQLPFDLGRRMTVHVRPTGPARFVIEHGRPNGIAWFDTP